MIFFRIVILILMVNMISLATHHMHYINFNDHKSKVLLDEAVAFDIFFNDESKENIELHLKAFAFELRDRKDETGYVISYAGKKAKKNESESNIKKFKDFLVKKRKIEPKQIVFIDGGYREKGITELFIVPKGAAEPKPVSTIPIEEVTFICEKETN